MLILPAVAEFQPLATEDIERLMWVKKIAVSGRALVLYLPKSALRALGYKAGNYVQIRVVEGHHILVSPLHEEIYELRKLR